MRQPVMDGGVIAQVKDFVFRAEAQRGRAGDFGGDGVRQAERQSGLSVGHGLPFFPRDLGLAQQAR